MSADSRLQQVWYERTPLWLFLLLLPLSLLFRLVVAIRRAAYARGFFASVRLAHPVVVVGNITVGGTGKTPFVIWLAQRLQEKGLRVGIVLRGYRGQSASWPRDVHADTPAAEVGDEAVVLALRTGAIVVAGPDRVAAARRAVEQGADFVLCDDGLQHYRLARDLEVAVVDEARRLGNGWLLPAGPLREPRSRLRSVDLIVRMRRLPDPDPPTVKPLLNTGAGPPEIAAVRRMGEAYSLTAAQSRPLDSFKGQRVHAIAGIGNPQAFFDSLRASGLEVDGRELPDHAAASRADIDFADDAPVLMTEKDAVKCRPLADSRHWVVPLDLALSESDAAVVDKLVRQVLQPSVNRASWN